MIDPEQPLLETIAQRWIPPEMMYAPVLDDFEPGGPRQPRYALLINPFYPKDAHASFGKHVLTPTFGVDQLRRHHSGSLADRILG